MHKPMIELKLYITRIYLQITKYAHAQTKFIMRKLECYRSRILFSFVNYSLKFELNSIIFLVILNEITFKLVLY